MKSMKPDEGSCVYGAGVLLRHLRALDKEFEGVRDGHADIEYIHRMRVASRRLRATLPLFAGCLPAKKSAVWMKEMRKVTQVLGEARDADVQIENLERYTREQNDPLHRPGLNRLLLRLRQKRARLQEPLTRALDSLSAARTLESMRAVLEPRAAQAESVYLYTPGLYAQAYNAVTRRLDELLAFDKIVPQVEKVKELHEMRIAAKWLRYTMEAFAPMYKGELKEWLQAVRAAQEDLGEIHDCDVWGEFIPRYLKKEEQRILVFFGHTRSYPRLVPGVEGYAAARLTERQARFTHFNAVWTNWKEEGLWDGLRRAVQTAGGSYNSMASNQDRPAF